MKYMRWVLALLVMLVSTGVWAQDTACDLDNAGALAERAYDYINAGEYELAIRDYTCALELSPDNPEYLNRRGIAYYGLGETGQALADYTRAMEVDPDYGNPYNNRGIIYSDRGDYQAAIADFTRSIDLHNDRLEISYYNRGGVYSEMGEYDLALADFNRVLEIDPDNARTYNNRGTIYFGRGDYQAAIADFTRSIELIPDRLEIPYWNRGSVYSEIGEYDLALADFNHALEENNTYPNTYLARGYTHLHLNDNQAAYADFAHYNEEMVDYWETQILDDAIIEGETFWLEEEQAYRFYFEAQAGQVINVEALTNSDTSDVDPLLVLLDPRGKAVMADYDSGVNLDAVIANFILPETGTYALQLSHAGFDPEEGEIILNLQITGDGVAADETITTTAFTTYRLVINETAEVFTTGGNMLNLREGPGLDYAIVAKLERGSLVKILEGPHKADRYAWWHVQTTDGVEGWAVEEADSNQTLALALLVDEEAIAVADEDRLNVRQEPRLGTAIVFQLEAGDRVTLVEAPTIADGFRWWKVRAADGTEGWVVDHFQNERTLIPARERD